MNKAQLIKEIEALGDNFQSNFVLIHKGYILAIRDVLKLIESKVPKPAMEILKKLQEFGESLTPEEKKQMFGDNK